MGVWILSEAIEYSGTNLTFSSYPFSLFDTLKYTHCREAAAAYCAHKKKVCGSIPPRSLTEVGALFFTLACVRVCVCTRARAPNFAKYNTSRLTYNQGYKMED